MYYFDRDYLKKYLKVNDTIDVLFNKDYLTVPSESDLENEKFGIGYNVYGQARKFSYIGVEAVKINNIIFTLNQLNNKLNPGSATDELPKSKEKSDDIKIDPKKESYASGDYIINLDTTSMYFGSKGPIISITEDLITYQTYIENAYKKVSCLSKFIRKG